MKKKFSKILGVGLALVLVFSFGGVFVAASSTVTVTSDPDGIPPDPVRGEWTLTVQYAGGKTPDHVDISIPPPTLYGHYLGVLGQEKEPLTGGMLIKLMAADPPYPHATWDLGMPGLSDQFGFVGATYNDATMTWTMTFNTLKKCEVGDNWLAMFGWWPGQEVYFDGVYNPIIEVTFTDGSKETPDGEQPTYIFDNEECITPALGLNAKGAQQKFWLNYIDVVTNPATGDSVPLGHKRKGENGVGQGGWLWAFDPGINLKTWGDPASPADVKVLAGGRPYTDSYGACHPAEDVIGDMGQVCLPDRFIEIQARAPGTLGEPGGDCEVEVWTCVLKDTVAQGPGDTCCPIEINEQVASAEKKWGELDHSKLDVHIEGLPDYDELIMMDGGLTWQDIKDLVEADLADWVESTDHEVWVDSGTCEDNDKAEPEVFKLDDGECMVYDVLAEQVWCDFLQLTPHEPAGGALVHWWLAKDTEANQLWIRDLMEDIVLRAGEDGFYGHEPGDDSNDDWSATGDYDPEKHPVASDHKDSITDWITGTGYYAASDPQYAEETGLIHFLPCEEWDPYLYKDTPMGEVSVVEEPWYGRSLTMDYHPGEIPGVTLAVIGNVAAEDVLVITLVEYQQDYNGENLILIQIGKKHFRAPPPPVQVKIPQIRWAGEKIVLEKDWGEHNTGRWVTFTVDQDSIGVLSPVEGWGWGYGNHVETWVMEDGIARVMFESEYEGQAEIKAVLYHNQHPGPLGIPIDNHDFPVFYLKLESIEPLEPDPAPLLPDADALFGVQVKGWFITKSSEHSSRPAKWLDIDPLTDSYPNVVNGGNGIPDDDHDILLPAGRWVLPDDWPTLAGIYELRTHWDLMNNWEDQVILSGISPLGPYDGAVVTTTPPTLAEAPVIGPQNTTQPVAIEDELIKWVATASVWADYRVALLDIDPPTVPAPHPNNNDWTTADLRNTVVPDGKIDWFDAPMPPAKVIFQVPEDQLLVDLSRVLKFGIEPYSIYDWVANSGTATGGTTTTLVDTARSWTVDALIDETVVIVRAGALYRRVITDNTATSLTFSALPTAVAGPTALTSGDMYFIMEGIWYAPYYEQEIPSHAIIPMGGIPEGYSWDSWGVGSVSLLDDGPYPFWTDLGQTTLPATDDEVIEVYTDNNGIAYVTINGLAVAGEVDIHAKVDYPYQRKHPALKSEEVTQVWGPLELSTHFESLTARTGDAPLTVTFINLTTKGILPYVSAIWDWDDGTAPGTTDWDFGDTIDHTYNNPGTYSPSLTITDSSVPPLVDVDTKEANYIVVGPVGEGMKGDFDGDLDIDLVDFAAFGDAYGSVSTDLNYDVIGDFDDDNDIDLVDFAQFGDVYGYGT